MKKVLSIFVLILSIFTFTSLSASASEVGTNELQRLYDNGIQDGTISSEISFDDWQKIVADNESKKPSTKGVISPMASYEGFAIKKGDIFVTDGTSFNGLTGHAAIATTSNYILDMPGFKIQTSKGMLNTSRQSTVADWIKYYAAKGTVWVYRVDPKYEWVANAAGDWADKHYYSSTGSATQDKFPEYSFSLLTSDTSKSYCSKIPYQAYYYGSGDLPFMVPVALSIIAPYDLINHFQPEYAPKLVKTFK